MKDEGVRRLAAIEQRLNAAGEAQLLAALAARPPSSAVAAALGLPAANAVGTSSPLAGPGAGDERGATRVESVPATGEAWLRLQLLPGLELLLAESASPAVRQLALKVQATVRAGEGDVSVSR